MALSSLPLSYCSNVHPGRSVAEVEQGLDEFMVAVRANYGAPLTAGLWLAAPVIRELADDPARLPAFRDGLERRRLGCHTLNAFPYGDFHSRRVKEEVYRPDWADARRLDYTIGCAEVLAALLPQGGEGSISTMPLTFKSFDRDTDHLDRCIGNLLQTARTCDRLHNETGRIIRLAIEPEPLCLIETTDEAVAFFTRLWSQAAEQNCLDAARRHLGLCYDVCHQAVEFEDIGASIRSLETAGIRINKVHVTCALQLDSPADNREGRQALAKYVEERYLHQTFARTRTGNVVRQLDLTEGLALDPPADFRDCAAWRIHFHVPVDAERLGPLATTRPELRQALIAVAALPYAPHLEVETYTWNVLPDQPVADGPQRLIDGLTRELLATRALLEELAAAAA